MGESSILAAAEAASQRLANDPEVSTDSRRPRATASGAATTAS